MISEFLPITKSILFGRLSPTRLVEKEDSDFQFVSYWNKAKKIMSCQSINEIDNTISDILCVCPENDSNTENTEHQIEDDIDLVLRELRGEYTPFFIFEHIPWCGFPCPHDTTKEMAFYDVITQLENKRAVLWLKETEKSLMSNELTFERVAECLTGIKSYIMHIRDYRKGKSDESKKAYDIVTTRLLDLYMTILLMCRLNEEHTERLNTKHLPTDFYEMYEFAYNDMPSGEYERAWKRGRFIFSAQMYMDDRTFNETNAKKLLDEAVGVTGHHDVDTIVEKCEMLLFCKTTNYALDKFSDNPSQDIYKSVLNLVNGKSDPREIITSLNTIKEKVNKCRIKDDTYNKGTLYRLNDEIQKLIDLYNDNLGESFVPRKDIKCSSPNPVHKYNTQDIKNKAIKELEFLKGTPKNSKNHIMDVRNHRLLVDAVIDFINTEDINPEIGTEIQIEMNQQDLRYAMFLVWERAIKGSGIKYDKYKRFVFNLFRHKFKNTEYNTFHKKFSTKPQCYDMRY